MRILVIEDTPEISSFLKKSLEEESFAVDVAEDGETGSYLARTNDYSVIILDYVLPKKSGAQVCQEIREKKKDVYIIIASVKSEIDTKVDLLELGADDYLIKPFSFKELLARIRALMRRPRLQLDEALTIDGFQFDPRHHLIRKGEKEIILTRKESMILHLLARNSGRIIPRTTIFENIWDIGGDLFSNALEMHLHNLRKKLGDEKKKALIKTFPGRGYMLRCTT